MRRFFRILLLLLALIALIFLIVEIRARMTYEPPTDFIDGKPPVKTLP